MGTAKNRGRCGRRKLGSPNGMIDETRSGRVCPYATGSSGPAAPVLFHAAFVLALSGQAIKSLFCPKTYSGSRSAQLNGWEGNTVSCAGSHRI